MKFTNAYELIYSLYEKDLIDGFDSSIRGDFEVRTSIDDEKILKILDEICADLIFGGTAIYQGCYEFEFDSNNDLSMSVQIDDDILEFHGNTFDIEQILSVISNYLSLQYIEKVEDLEFQISLDIELEYNNIEKSDYELLVFTIKDFDSSEELTNEINRKIKECDIDKLKELVIDELVKQHKDNHSYTGFSLTIDESQITSYSASGHEEVEDFKESLENHIIDIEIDFTKLGID
jgi:hypothetical protein